VTGRIAPAVVHGMRGLGDNIYQRAFVKALAPRGVYIRTPWPELYEDIPGVRFLRDATTLRTQARNLERQPAARWSDAPTVHRRIAVGYGAGHLRRGSIVDAMRAAFKCEPAGFDLPAFAPSIESSRPIAVVRPVTARREWLNVARNPLPEYVARVAADLIDRGYFVVSVADVADGAEWFVGDPPPASLELHRGELPVRELLGLIRSAAVVVGGVGWIVPACIAAGVPLFCILGGHGGHNAPDRITDPARMRLDRVGFARPDHFCACESMRHECDKRNSNLGEQWRAFRVAHGL
jgi:hypothetical protein